MVIRTANGPHRYWPLESNHRRGSTGYNAVSRYRADASQQLLVSAVAEVLNKIRLGWATVLRSTLYFTDRVITSLAFQEQGLRVHHKS